MRIGSHFSGGISPWTVVRVPTAKRCGRAGKYRRDRLIERFGADAAPPLPIMHLEPGQRAMIGLDLDLMKQAAVKAKERQRDGGGDKRSAKAKSVPPTVGEPISRSGETNRKVAKTVGVGHATVAKAKLVKDNLAGIGGIEERRARITNLENANCRF